MGRKNFACTLVLLVFLFPLSARQFGYSLSYGGERVKTSSYIGSSLRFVWEPFEWDHFNPSVGGEVSFGFDTKGMLRIQSNSIVCNVDLFRTLDHPFWFIAHNKIAYDPSIGIGVQVRYDGGLVRPALYLAASPLKFSQPDFWYEALSPFFIYSSEGWSWGVALFRFTYMFL